jgi:hypothetical protein
MPRQFTVGVIGAGFIGPAHIEGIRRLGHRVLAIAEFKRFLQQFPSHEKAPQVRYGLALSLFNAGLHAEAEPDLQALLGEGKVPEAARLIEALRAFAHRIVDIGISATLGRHGTWTGSRPTLGSPRRGVKEAATAPPAAAHCPRPAPPPRTPINP